MFCLSDKLRGPVSSRVEIEQKLREKLEKQLKMD